LAHADAAASYDGHSAEALAAMIGLPRVLVFDVVGSTLDVAHELGEQGGEAGTLVLADAQSAGRGRMGRTWQSRPGHGLWLTLLERPASDDTLSVRSLRIALALAPAFEPFATGPVRLKWPNDVYVGGRKLAGVLLEARWRGARLDWLAVGVGINVTAPPELDAGSLAPETRRVAVLEAVVPALRRAVATPGPLSPNEIAAFAARDIAAGRRCELPGEGRVAGIDAAGALLIDTDRGRAAFHGGSLVLTAPGLTSLGDAT
jgi:BirA family biotin operon repressor/biotin-[acetyl-CoA-carboxylase] ligase